MAPKIPEVDGFEWSGPPKVYGIRHDDRYLVRPADAEALVTLLRDNRRAFVSFQDCPAWR